MKAPITLRANPNYKYNFFTSGLIKEDNNRYLGYSESSQHLNDGSSAHGTRPTIVQHLICTLQASAHVPTPAKVKLPKNPCQSV